ncbi:hypothetical protein C8Q80DRAFT_1273717 [Daedaleopsis nitida]|nr:hypothetical protein C8Q80DRAFT_1273717 [Daedaleopsis nitida]
MSEQAGSESNVDATATQPSPRVASWPFKPNADVILRTSDQTDFYLFKCILEEVSPVFSDILALPQPTVHPAASEQPEDSKGDTDQTRFKPASLDILKPVIAAAHKYQMDEVLLTLEEALKAFAQDAPLRVYAIAVLYGMPDAMHTAARSFLALSSSRANECVDELCHITGKDYYRLLSFRRRCVATLRDSLSDLSWLPAGGWTFAHCGSCAYGNMHSYALQGFDTRRWITVWMDDHYQRLIAILLERPCSEAVEDQSLCEQALQIATQCNTCRQVVHNDMRLFMEKLRIHVNEKLDTVSLDG